MILCKFIVFKWSLVSNGKFVCHTFHFIGKCGPNYPINFKCKLVNENLKERNFYPCHDCIVSKYLTDQRQTVLYPTSRHFKNDSFYTWSSQISSIYWKLFANSLRVMVIFHRTFHQQWAPYQNFITVGCWVFGTIVFPSSCFISQQI